MTKKIALMAGLFFLVISSIGQSWSMKSAQAAASPLIISAVQISGGEGKTNDDFVELYNPNPEPFNLNGYRLVKRSGTGTTDSAIKSWGSDTFIPAYSFYLWANSGFTAINSTPDTTTSSTLADNNGVAIRFGANDSGALVNSVSWGTASNGFTTTGLENPEPGKAIVRDSLFTESGYAISVSQPRNTASQVLPATPTETPSIETDEATCELVASTEGNVSSESFIFTNKGTTNWESPEYIVKAAGQTDIALETGKIVAPNGTLAVTAQVMAPAKVGEYRFEWQMSKGGVKFGQACTLQVKVTSVPIETPQNPQNPESPVPSEPEQPEQPPVPEQPQTPESEEAAPDNQAIKITELLVNPEGKDDGQEVVELYNSGDTKINLNNWILDDVADGGAVTSDKYVLSNIEINPKSYLAVTLPAGKAVLNNTKGDVLSIIDSAGQFIDTVTYVIASSPEAKSYSLIGAEWQWTAPTLGAVNVGNSEEPEEEEEEVPAPTSVTIKGLEISEIYPAPAKGSSEFIELYNADNKSIDLANVILRVGDKTKTLATATMLPGKYLVLKDAQLSLALLDKGTEIELQELDGDSIDKVTYPKANKGESYAKINGAFAWTTTVTPGEVNTLTVKPEPSTPTTTKIVKKTTTTTKTTPTKTTTTKKIVTKKTTPVASTKISNSLPQNNSLISTNAGNEEVSSEQRNKPDNNIVNVIAVILASLGAGSLAIYKFGFGAV